MVNCFRGMFDRRKTFSLTSSRNRCQKSSPSRIFNTLGAGILTCEEPLLKLCWMKMCSSDNHYTTAPQMLFTALPKSKFYPLFKNSIKFDYNLINSKILRCMPSFLTCFFKLIHFHRINVIFSSSLQKFFPFHFAYFVS